MNIQKQKISKYLLTSSIFLIIILQYILWHTNNDALPARDAADYILSSYHLMDFIQNHSIIDSLKAFIVQGNWKSNPMSHIIMPLLWITYNSKVSVIIINSLFLLMSLVFTTKLIDNFLSYKKSLTVIFAIFSTPFIFERTLSYMPELPSIAFTMTGLYYFYKYYESYKLKHLVLSAIAIGSTLTIRPLTSIVVLGPALGLFYIFKTNDLKKELIPTIAITVICLSLPIINVFTTIPSEIIYLMIGLITISLISCIYIKPIYRFIIISFSIPTLWYLPKFNLWGEYLHSVFFSEYGARTGARISGDYLAQIFEYLFVLEIWIILIPLTFLILYKKKKDIKANHFILTCFVSALFAIFISGFNSTSETRFVSLSIFIILLSSLVLFIKTYIYSRYLIFFISLFYVLTNVTSSLTTDNFLRNMTYFKISYPNKHVYDDNFIKALNTIFDSLNYTPQKYPYNKEDISEVFYTYMGQKNYFYYSIVQSKNRLPFLDLWNFNIYTYENNQQNFLSFFEPRAKEYLTNKIPPEKLVNALLNNHHSILLGPISGDILINPIWHYYETKLSIYLLRSLDQIKASDQFEVVKFNYKYEENTFDFYFITLKSRL